MSGRSPAYVPTTSARVRSTSIVALTVSSSRSTSQPAADGRAAGPSNGASVVPISQWSGHGTRKTILPGTRMVRPIVLGIRARGTTRWAPRLGRIRIDAPLNGWSGSAAQTPVASTTAPGRDLELGAGRQVLGAERVEHARRAVRPKAGGADPGDRHAAGGDRRAGHGQRVARVVLDPVVVDEAAAQTLGPQRRGELERVGLRQPPMPAAVVPRAEDVVQGQPGVVERLRARTGCRRSGTAAARSGRGAARASAGASARRAPRARARTGTARGSAGRRGSAATSATTSRPRCRPAR